MKNNNSVFYHPLLATLAFLLLAAPGVRAQGGTAPAGARNQPQVSSTAQPTGVPTANAAAGVLITNKIQFHGQAPNTQINYRADPLDVCPNVVDPTNHGIQSQPYQFEFESNCDGQIDTWYDQCRARPNFIWTIKYFTESGGIYQEQWRDVTSGDFSKIRLYLYDRVPYSFGPYMPATPDNGQATQAGGNSNFSTIPPNTYCDITPPVNTVQEGELITHVQLECTGYACGSFQPHQDVIQIRYYKRKPGPISLAGSPTDLCRDQTYALSFSAPFDASSYSMSATNGAIITSYNGSAPTLSLASVPPTATSVTISISAYDPTARCGAYYSAAQTLTIPVRRAPAAATNMQIDGLCPSSANKTVSINTVAVPTGQTGSIQYHWYLSGSIPQGTYLKFNGMQATDFPFSPNSSTLIQLIAPTVGDVTVNVEAKVANTGCGGAGPVLSKTFRIGNIEADCPTGVVTFSSCGEPTFTLTGAPGLSYYITQQPYNITYSDNVTPIPGATATVGASPSPTATTLPITLNFSRAYFDLGVLVTSPCAASTGYKNCVVRVAVAKKIIDCFGKEGQPAAELPAQTVRLYPNPTTGEVSVQPEVPTRYQWVRVLSLMGRELLRQSADSETGITRFDVRELPAGLYEVQLFDGKKLTTQRLQKN